MFDMFPGFLLLASASSLVTSVALLSHQQALSYNSVWQYPVKTFISALLFLINRSRILDTRFNVMLASLGCCLLDLMPSLI